MGNKKDRPIPSTNEIVRFLHCGHCLKGLPPGKSPREWASVEVGFTILGIQVWCKRCERNILHMDFQGKKFPANTSATDPKELAS